MSPLDWLLLAILGVSALMGLLRGFVGIVASFAAWILGGWSALALGGGLARLIAERPDPSPVQMLIGYALCFLATSLTIALIAFLVRRLLSAAGLGGVDRALGFTIGGLRGFVLGCAVVLLLGFTPFTRQPQWRGSSLLPLFKPGARWMATWLPVGLRVHLDLDGTAPPRNMPVLPPLPRLPA